MKPVNLFFLVFLLVVFVGVFSLQAVALQFGLRWMKVAEVSIGKALLLMVLFFVAAIPPALVFTVALVVSGIEMTGFIEYLVSGTLQLAVSGFVVAKLYGAEWKRGVQAVLPSIIVPLGCAAFLVLVMRPFLYEAYQIPANSMAPTLLGWHLEAPCPECGAPAYGSPPQGMAHPAEGLQMICSRELRPVMVRNVNPEVHTTDRILVAKFVTPKRWDIIVFKLPSDPNVFYVKRLVGLPGEEIFICDGGVWANGERLVPPEPIRDIQYLTTLEFAPANWADESDPARLGSGEYFVLGDFSAQSSDSRFWETGAPGHPAYAVPKSHVVGVAVNIYWPINRWRAFR